ncbi:MAG: hypothetical protein ACRBBJ_08180 [Rhodomicrobiaceae bacterium]
MGAPFEGNWVDVKAAYFVSLGGGEIAWTIITVGFCILALTVGSWHEKHAYEKVKK